MSARAVVTRPLSIDPAAFVGDRRVASLGAGSVVGERSAIERADCRNWVLLLVSFELRFERFPFLVGNLFPLPTTPALGEA